MSESEDIVIDETIHGNSGGEGAASGGKDAPGGQGNSPDTKDTGKDDGQDKEGDKPGEGEGDKNDGNAQGGDAPSDKNGGERGEGQQDESDNGDDGDKTPPEDKTYSITLDLMARLTESKKNLTTIVTSYYYYTFEYPLQEAIARICTDSDDNFFIEKRVAELDKQTAKAIVLSLKNHASWYEKPQITGYKKYLFDFFEKFKLSSIECVLFENIEKWSNSKWITYNMNNQLWVSVCENSFVGSETQISTARFVIDNIREEADYNYLSDKYDSLTSVYHELNNYKRIMSLPEDKSYGIDYRGALEDLLPHFNTFVTFVHGN